MGMTDNYSKKKICHICSYYENILFDNLVRAQDGYTDAKVFFFKKYGSANQYGKSYIDEINCFRELDRFFFYIKEKKVYEAFLKQYNGEHFDINFAHSLFSNGYIAYRAKKNLGTPYVVMVQNTDLNVFYKYRPYLRGVGLKILLSSSNIIFASQSYLDTLLNKYIPRRYRNAIKEKATVIPYGIEDVFYKSSGKTKKEIDKSHVSIISVGLICRNKNHSALCQAIESIRTRGVDASLTIIGKVGNKQIAEEVQKYSFVTVLPYMTKEELAEQYRKNDIFALTSLTETFGLVYAEALSQGLPIIYSRGQGFDGQFEDGWVGYAVDAKDVDSIADGIMRAIENHGLLSERAVPASEKYKWDVITQQYLDMYDSICREHKK